jgi:F-type H+-transporting ATPase subunit delta
MSREAVVAGRYAKAMYEIAAEEGRTIEIEDELRSLVIVLNDDVLIKQFIDSPNISEVEKWKVLAAGLEEQVSKPVLSLAKLIIERGRVEILPELLNSYIRITSDALGLANAIVYTTYPLSEQEKENVATEFGTLLNKKIRVINEIDSELLGGMKVRIGDTLYDGSLAGKLRRLEKSFRRQAL